MFHTSKWIFSSVRRGTNATRKGRHVVKARIMSTQKTYMKSGTDSANKLYTGAET